MLIISLSPTGWCGRGRTWDLVLTFAGLQTGLYQQGRRTLEGHRHQLYKRLMHKSEYLFILQLNWDDLVDISSILSW